MDVPMVVPLVWITIHPVLTIVIQDYFFEY